MEVVRLAESWNQLTHSHFDKLLELLEEWPQSAAKTALVDKLHKIEQCQKWQSLCGLLGEAIGKSTTRRMFSQRKEACNQLLVAAVKSLRTAADNVDRLAAYDKAAALVAQLVSGREEAEPAEKRTKWNSRLAEQWRHDAERLNQEREARRETSLRFLGASVVWNLEWLVLLKDAYGFSFTELALLIEAAYQAWKGLTMDVQPDTLKRAFERFGKRNPRFLDP